MKLAVLASVCVTALVTYGEASVSGGVLTVPVASGTQDGYTADQLAAINGGSVTEIKKTGAGTLVSKGIANYSGVIRVAGGTMQIAKDDKTGLGTTAGATYVESGATVSFGNSNCGADTEEFHIAGTGVNNGGALLGGSYVVISKLVLEADAKVVMGDRSEYRKATGGFLDLKGHTLIVESPTAGSCEYYFSVNEVRSVGTVVANNFRFFKVCSDVPLANNLKGKFVLRGTTALLCASADATKRDIRWDLEWEKGSSGTTYVTQGPFNWAGDWIVGEGRSATFDAVTVNMYGNVRGAGGIYKGNDANGEIRLYGTNNDFTGNVEVRGGKVIVMKRAGLFANCATRVKFTNTDGAMFAVGAKTASNPEGFTAAEIQDFFVTMKSTTTGVKGIYVPEGETFTGAVTFDSANTASKDYRGCDASKFGACGGGTCILTGPYVNRPSLKVYTYGDLRFSNPTDDSDRVNALGKCWVVAGTVTFDNAGTLDFGGNTIHCSGSTGSLMPNVIYSGNTKVANVTAYSPQDGNNQNGRTAFGAGSSMTGLIHMSTDGAMDSGSVVVNGGDVTEQGADGYAGSWGQGAYVVESGTMTVANNVLFGVQPPAIGQLFVNGGTYDAKNILLGCAGTGVVYQTAGTIKSANNVTLGYNMGTATQRPYSSMTIAGGSFVSDSDVSVGARANAVSTLNLIGGSFQARRIVASDVSGAWADVAFDGGTLKSSQNVSSGWNLLSGDNLKVTVYAGGAAVDTSGVRCGLGRPLVAATGKGVSAITMPQESYTGFAAPPVITITGDGRGASAVPVYDSVSGTVTGIRVTSPGYGYTTATATMFRGNSDYYTAKGPIALTVTLADNTAPVKLTKRGAGTLTLAAGDLPSDAVVYVEAGSIDGAGATFAEYSTDIEKAATGAYGSIPSWPAGAVLSFTHMEKLDPNVRKYTLVAFSSRTPTTVPPLAPGCVLPGGWEVRLVGNELVLLKPKGWVVIVR